MLVSNWKEVLLKSWAVWFAAAGLALPELLDLIAANTDALPFTPEWKNTIRVVALALIPVVRIVRQKSLQPPAIEPLRK